MRTAPVIALALAACVPGRSRIDAGRFAPRPEWTPAAYLLGEVRPAKAELTRDDAIEDIAYLQHVLDQAWANDSAMTRDSWKSLRETLRDLPLRDHDRASLCAAIAEEARNSTLSVTLDGAPCRRDREGVMEVLQKVPPGRNYAWRIDDDDRSKVGVLTIGRFVDPADPGWAGFDQVLAAIAAQDVVVIDLQDAIGNDPRSALAITGALGAQAMRPEYAIPPVVRANAFVDVVRRNHAARFPDAAAPRDRALWLPLSTADDYVRAGREHAKVERGAPLGKAVVLWGARCESSCQLVVQLARHSRFETIGSASVVNRLNGDEHGLVRLPRSGVEVVFPTASYGPYANRLLSSGGAGFARGVLDVAHRDAHARAGAKAWREQEVPPCSAIAIDPEAVRRKQVQHCAVKRSPDDPAGAIVTMKLDEARARAFLASCPNTSPETVLHHPVRLTTLATVRSTVDGLARIASAPFVDSVSSDCPGSKPHPPKHD